MVNVEDGVVSLVLVASKDACAIISSNSHLSESGSGMQLSDSDEGVGLADGGGVRRSKRLGRLRALKGEGAAAMRRVGGFQRIVK